MFHYTIRTRRRSKAAFEGSESTAGLFDWPVFTSCGIIIDMSLRQLREQRMMTQREVAERAHITVTTLSRIENGRVAPSFRTVRSLAAVFGVSAQQMHEIVTASQLPLWAADTQGGEPEQ